MIKKINKNDSHRATSQKDQRHIQFRNGSIGLENPTENPAPQTLVFVTINFAS